MSRSQINPRYITWLCCIDPAWCYPRYSYIWSEQPIAAKKRTSAFSRISQVKLLARDLAKAARHPIVKESPVGRHREGLDIRALGRSGGTELFDVTICHPLSQARIRDVVENPMNLLKAAWTAKVSRYSGRLQAAGTRFNLLPFRCQHCGWHPGRSQGVMLCCKYHRGKVI